MKRIIVRIAVSTCVMFTVFMALLTAIALVLAGPRYGLVYTVTLMVAVFVLAVLQFIWFSDCLIKRLAYALRILGFGLCAFAALVVCALLGSWVPVDNPYAWVTFTLIYLVILGLMCIGYQVYFKKTCGSYDAALQRYHETAMKEES